MQLGQSSQAPNTNSLGLLYAVWAIAVYHNLLYYHWIPESLAPCEQGISCTSRQIEWLGFVTIPLLSLTAFSLITARRAPFKTWQPIHGSGGRTSDARGIL